MTEKVDPFTLMGRLVRRDYKPRTRVYEVIDVAGMYVKLGTTSSHTKGARNASQLVSRWYDFESLDEVEADISEESSVSED